MEAVMNITAPVFGLGLLGYLAARLGWFPDEAAGGLARFVFDIAAAKDLATTTASLSTAFSLLSVSVVVYLLGAMG